MSEAAAPEAPIPALDVLVVHGLAGQAALVRGMIEAQGHRVRVVHDWRMAETMLTLHVIGAVLMAVTTPGSRRVSAARLMRASQARWASLPMVGLGTGTALHETRTALAEGFDAVVTPPFQAEALAAALREAVRLREPPVLVDAAIRATLRASHGPEALAALDDAALALVADLMYPVLTDAVEGEAIGEALASVAEAMQGIGASYAAGLARGILEAGPRSTHSARPLLPVIISTRFALRTDRMNAAIEDPIWGASDTPSGETP